jgi:hypothetical protein
VTAARDCDEPRAGGSDELWRFSTLTREWFHVDDTGPDGIHPSARYSHAMTPLGMDLWVHGGGV